ncbi:MAG: hypothetical protein ABIJ59_01705 [Pseudomonadota bacterium]
MIRLEQYDEAEKTLRGEIKRREDKKAAKVMKKQNRRTEWLSYLKQLKNTHKRKTRLMEVIDRLENNSIIGEHLKQPQSGDLFK